MHPLRCPGGGIGRHRRLKSDCDARSSRARGTKSLTCPPSPIGRGDGLRSRAIGVRISGRVPILRRLAQWQSIRLISERPLDRSQDRRPNTPVAQRIRAPVYEAGGCRFEPYRACQFQSIFPDRQAVRHLTVNEAIARSIRARGAKQTCSSEAEQRPHKAWVAGSFPATSINRLMRP
jgi:hypothetical protein